MDAVGGSWSLTSVTIEEGIDEIQSGAFYDCYVLNNILIPRSVTYIEDEPFINCGTVRKNIYCWRNSYAEAWAKEHGHRVVLLDNLNFGTNGLVELSPMTMYIGDQAYVGNCFPALESVTPVFTSSNPKVISIDKDGLVTALAGGTSKITISAGGKTKSAVFKVNNGIRPLSITIPEEIWIPLNRTYQIDLQIEPANAFRNIIWESSTNAFATISKTGLIKPTGKTGRFTLRAYNQKDIETHIYDGWTDTYPVTDIWSEECLIRIIPSVTGVSFAQKEITIADGMPYQLTATLHCGSQKLVNQYITFTSSNEDVATVDDKGIVTPLRTGQTTIKATSGPYSATCTVNVAMVVTDISLPRSITLSACRNIPYQLEAVVTTGKQQFINRFVTFISDTPDVADVTADGLVTFRGSGSAVITATAESGVTASCTISNTAAAHAHKTFIPAAAPYCDVNGNKDYYACDDCGAAFDLIDGAYVAITQADWLIPAPNIHHYADGRCTECGKTVDTTGLATLKLPASLTAISADAFTNIAAQVIIVPDSVVRIDAGAFAGCDRLQYAFLPAALETDSAFVLEDVFGGRKPIVIFQ
ncbi:MAG: Ig-like domain-containing protein [Clostridia bacterium]|nr:Ig-like domain-containing protein [Clostridia bacterium]